MAEFSLLENEYKNVMSFPRYKIAVLGDSTPLPRPRDGTKVEDTYLFKLMHESNHLIFDKCLRAADTTDFLIEEKKEDYYDLDCDYYILHLGIGDCAPRLFSKRTKSVFNAMSHFFILRTMAKSIRYYFKKRRLYYTKKQRLQNVPIEYFVKNLQLIIKNILHYNPRIKKILFINIVYPGSFLRERSFDIENIIYQYNKVFEEMANQFSMVSLIDVWSEIKNNHRLLLADAHHLSNEAHHLLYEKIKRILEQ